MVIKISFLSGVIDSSILLDDLFDNIRIIDPINNTIIDSNDKENTVLGKCYGCFSNDTVCNNCICLKAYKYNKQFMKLKYDRNKIYLVVATPIIEKGTKYIVETIRDITDSALVDDVETKTIEKLQEEIEKVKELAVTDELTGCYNRRYLYEIFQQLIDKYINSKENLSIAIMDLDFFKGINDTHGHLAGDYILKKVIELIKNVIRKDDLVIRYGGEEFIIIFKHTSSEKAIKYIDRIRGVIESYNFLYNNIRIPLTASFGVASLNKNVKDVEEFIALADNNLYKAKTNGRNMVIG